MMTIRKIYILIVQLVKDNFAICKDCHLKLLTRRFMMLNFQFVKNTWQVVKYFFIYIFKS